MLDESGLSQRPPRCRTWAPRGQTPVREFNFNWEKLSAAAGITFHNFYFRLYPDAIRGPEVIDFLTSLVRHVRRPLLVVWDRLPAHKSALVQEFLGYSEGYIESQCCPGKVAPTDGKSLPLNVLWSVLPGNDLKSRGRKWPPERSIPTRHNGG